MIHTGDGPVQVFEPAHVSILQPWLTFAAQAVTGMELVAVGGSLSALRQEWLAVWWADDAVHYLYGDVMQCSQGQEERGLFAGEAMTSLGFVAGHIRSAVVWWEYAARVLVACGDVERASLHRLLGDHAAAQQARLQMIVQQVEAWMVWVSQTWGIALPAQEGA